MSIEIDLKNWQAQTNTSALADAQNYAFHHPGLIDFLHWLYQDLASGNCISTQKIKFPCAVFPASKMQQTDPESVLGNLSTINSANLPAEFDHLGGLYLAGLQARNLQLWDGKTFAMETLNTAKKLSLTVYQSSYFRTLKSCDVLEFELLTQYGKHQPKPIDYLDFSKRLILRNQLHQIGNPLLESCGRSASIGISMAIIFRQNKKNYGLLRTCQARLATEITCLHSVPSLMFQPISAQVSAEYSVMHNFYREYLEEVFNQPEADHQETPFNDFYKNPNLDYIKALLANGSAKLKFTGISIDLLKLRPEICLSLVIDDESWIKQHQREACERNDLLPIDIGSYFDIQSKFSLNQLSRLNAFQLSDQKQLPGYLLNPSFFSPPGFAAFWMAGV